MRRRYEGHEPAERQDWPDLGAIMETRTDERTGRWSIRVNGELVAEGRQSEPTPLFPTGHMPW